MHLKVHWKTFHHICFLNLPPTQNSREALHTAWGMYCTIHLLEIIRQSDFSSPLFYPSLLVPYTTFRAVPILAPNSRTYSYSKNDSPTQRYGESATLRIKDTRSRRLSDSMIQGVDDSPHHWYAESTTPRITDTESRLLNFLKENSLYRGYGESLTQRIVDTENHRLPVSMSRGVADSAYRWYGESQTPRIGESGSRRLCVSVIRGVASWKKNSLASISVL